MKICDEKLRADVGAIANGIGCTEGPTFLNSIPEIEDEYQAGLIAPDS